MKKLTFAGETHEAERIERTSDSIVGYNGSSEVFGFRGISDFSGYEIEGEYDTPAQTPEQVLMEIQELKKRLAATEKTTLALIDFM